MATAATSAPISGWLPERKAVASTVSSRPEAPHEPALSCGLQ